MAGRILKLEELSSTVFGNLDKSRTAIFISFSPIEGHGAHLPLGLDLFNAEYFAQRAAEVTVERMPEFDSVVCRAFPVGSQLYKQPGSLRTDSATVFKIARDVGESLAGWGYEYIFLLSGHGSPRDIVALEAAAVKVSRKFRIQMHNLSGAMAVRFLKGEYLDKISLLMPEPLDDRDRELLKKDTHGGWWETSMMLRLKPHLVHPEYKLLPDTEKSGDDDNLKPSYYGSPSKASVGFAEASEKVMIGEAGDLIVECLSGGDIRKRATSPLYKVLPLRPGFKRHLILGIVVTIKAAVLIWLISRAFLS
jgi:creatinine amidohydrolase